MTALAWDQVGDRIYQTGIDRGVLYLKDGTAVPWNGLTGMDDGSDSELKQFYLDGVKFFQKVTPGDFVGKLKAFTYPDEFDQVTGVKSPVAGLSYHEQPPQSFNLSYRTRVGNDLEGDDYGYKLHLLYNLLAVPENKVFDTKNETVTPVEFGWSLTGTPSMAPGYRPTVHISINSVDTNPDVLQELENILYGTGISEPRFPEIDEVESIFREFTALIIVDNGDGTWTAIDAHDSYITMLDSTTFKIEDVNAEYIDPYTYEIESTFVPYLLDTIFDFITVKDTDDQYWAFSITNDGTVDINDSTTAPTELLHILLKAPDTGIWELTATTDGVLNIADTGLTGGDHISIVKMKSPDNTIWNLSATNDGYVDISPA